MNAPFKREKTAAEATLHGQFAGLAKGANAKGAFARFEALGLPSRRVESWHYTDLRSFLKDAAPLAAAPDYAAISAAKSVLAQEPKLGVARLVLLDGYYVAELSDALPVGVTMTAGAPDAPIADKADAMLALAAAFASDGFTLNVSGDVSPFEIIHLFSAMGTVASYSRLAVKLEDGAKATIVERGLGAGPGAERHRLMQISVGRHARLDHLVCLEDQPKLNLESLSLELTEGAELRGFGLALGGELTRRQIFATLAGPNANLALAGLALLDGERRADATLEVLHAAPHGMSREFFRYIVADEAAGVFQGKVIVASGAQKTDGAMKSQAILLSPTASMNNKPELEIYADDVACGHGATVGALDPEQVFYLEARGIPRVEAEAMLLEAFGAEAIARVADEGLAEAMLEKARAWFAARGAKI